MNSSGGRSTFSIIGFNRVYLPEIKAYYFTLYLNKLDKIGEKRQKKMQIEKNKDNEIDPEYKYLSYLL